MARRPDITPDASMSAADLSDLRRRYALPSESSLQQVYADVSSVSMVLKARCR